MTMTHPHRPPSTRPGLQHALLLAAALLATGWAPALHAQNIDVNKALNLFQSMARPALPAPVAPANEAHTDDLVKLLSQSLSDIDEAKEIEIGRQLAAILLGSRPLHGDMALQRYVNRLGRWISLQTARPGLPWTFAVLDDSGYNAFAAPGGYVFVTKGLVDRCADESELAGILAHEITHIISKHHLKAIQKTARSGLLTQLVSSQLSRNANIPAGLSAQLISLGRDVYSKGLDQTDEYEADRNGVVLSARAGLDPYGLAAVLQQLRTAAPDNPMFSLTLSTHPPAQARLDQMESAMGSRLDALSGKAGVTVAQRLARAPK